MLWKTVDAVTGDDLENIIGKWEFAELEALAEAIDNGAASAPFPLTQGSCSQEVAQGQRGERRCRRADSRPVLAACVQGSASARVPGQLHSQ
ncbi:hypothetical protein [Rhodococcus sp. ZPP]|uniref:hypothetical protein n=1 Tax=Rhodococcus sp. ZPP TaxID=2749906 RepID=UPI001FCE2503|nr:hypothetical protein [Rhodococcus sp. ZPP]